MTRLLLVCPEPLDRGQPAGIGIRFLEIARVLRADGHDVALLSRDEITAESIARASSAADAAVVQGHVANDFFAHARTIPTVIDLYDPFIIENLHYYESRGGEVFAHDHATLINSLARGDFFLCASEAQRLFYVGMLLATGRVNPVLFAADPQLQSLIALAPFGVQPRRQRIPADLQNPQVLFGGIYDWYEPILAVDAIAIARETLPRITLTFTTHPNPAITPQGKAAEVMAYVKQKRYDSFVRFEPWVEYDRRGEFLDRFAAALLTFRQSLETDLSMRTRVYDYLWAGIPIVTSSAPGTDEILARYNAGAIVRSESPREYAEAIVRVIRDEHNAMTSGTSDFVAAHQWPAVLEPLRAFCRAPRVDETKDTFATRLQLPERPASILDRLKRRIGGSL
jgi:glycosyltransferase involved in cell wall biosynthesis